MSVSTGKGERFTCDPPGLLMLASVDDIALLESDAMEHDSCPSQRHAGL